MKNKSKSGQRIPSLDGWRALSILMVLGAHTKSTYDFPAQLDPLFKWAFDGDLGVRTFFVISGFLITWLLLKEEKQNQTINLKKFYIRRILRIWPVYFAYLFTLFILQTLTPYHQTPAVWAGNLLFLTNFVGANWTSGHLWSLAVEEQFYFLWPLALFLCRSNQGRKGILITSLLVPPISRVLTYMHLSQNPWNILFADYSFFNYCDSLALGCLFGVLFFHHPEKITACSRRLIIPSLLCIFIPFLCNRLLILGVLTVPFGPLMQGMGVCFLMIYSISENKSWLYRVLNYPIFVVAGILSYSIYIWQMIFCSDPRVFGLEGGILFSWKTWYLAVIVVAICSYLFLEKPFLNLRKKFHN